MEGLKIHIGKNSGGWKFMFNHNDWKYYKNMKELKEFIDSGQLINEYGEEYDIEEFWEFVEKKQENPKMIDNKQYYEEWIPKNEPQMVESWAHRDASKKNYYQEIVEGYRFLTSTEFS